MKLFLLFFILVSKSRGRVVMVFWPSWGIQELKNLLITWKKEIPFTPAEYIKCRYKGYALQPVICICLHSAPPPPQSLVVCCVCHLASEEKPSGITASAAVNARWADSHYGKLIGITPSQHVRRKVGQFIKSLSWLASASVWVCSWMFVMVDFKNRLWSFFSPSSHISALTLPCKTFTLGSAGQN